MNWGETRKKLMATGTLKPLPEEWREGIDLNCANLHCADLRNANLRSANLNSTRLCGADLRCADLCNASLHNTGLRNADLRGADLCGADLRCADLRNADLRGANLHCADLRNANLSGARGLLEPSAWLREHFECDSLGIIVFKAIGDYTSFASPAYWTIEPGAFLHETVNRNPTDECGCGVNFATREWCKDKYTAVSLWRCRIRWADLASVVVPYNTDGKARCGTLELLEIVERDK